MLLVLACTVRRFCSVRLFSAKVRRFVVPRPVVGAKLRTMQIAPRVMESVLTAELLDLKRLFEKYNHEVRIAGGAVRDLIMNIVPVDVDLATTATPEEMKEMFNKEKIRMLNKRGEKHGTITCRMNNTENFEVTTLRVDILCDGRRADVEFTRDWVKDANRRDLTINAMSADFDGKVYDYFGGIEDLKNRHIAFVGDAEARIQEDYLRILRYFRFYGKVANSPNNHDPSTLAAIKANVDGLSGISGERLWFELKKIVTGDYADSLIRIMYDCGVFSHIGLPQQPSLEQFETVYNRAIKLRPNVMTILASLFTSLEEVDNFDDRMKVSTAERLISIYVVLNRNNPLFQRTDVEGEKMLKKMCYNLFSRKVESQDMAHIEEVLKYVGNGDMVNKLKVWRPEQFPLVSLTLVDQLNYTKGPQLSWVMLQLFKKWLDSDYSLTNEQLLEAVADLPPNEVLQSSFAEMKLKERWKKIHRRS